MLGVVFSGWNEVALAWPGGEIWFVKHSQQVGH